MTNENILMALKVFGVLFIHLATIASLGYAIWTTVICITNIILKIIQHSVVVARNIAYSKVNYYTECTAITFVWCLFAVLKYFLTFYPISYLTN